MSISKTSRGKALIAIAFAGGMLNLQLPAQSEYKPESPFLTIQQIVNNTVVGPETRAYYLLKLANAYLTGGDRAALETQFRSITIDPLKMTHRGKSLMDRFLITWTDQFSTREGQKAQQENRNLDTPYELKSVKRENFKLADKAIQAALVQLGHSSEQLDKMNMLFIASRLYQLMGNVSGMRGCNEVLEQAIEAGEISSPVDEKQINAATSILNLMSNCLLPVYISDLPEGDPSEHQVIATPFTEENFKKSEKLKLRAVAMLDRLEAQNDLRRKGHRDLSLWYKQLGKVEEAETQKTILFDLIGIKDDRLLFPQPGSCGHVFWWQLSRGSLFAMECGMG